MTIHDHYQESPMMAQYDGISTDQWDNSCKVVPQVQLVYKYYYN